MQLENLLSFKKYSLFSFEYKFRKSMKCQNYVLHMYGEIIDNMLNRITYKRMTHYFLTKDEDFVCVDYFIQIDGPSLHVHGQH